MIKISKIIILFFFLTSLKANADLLWNIEIAKNYIQKNDFQNAKNYLHHYILNNPNDEDGFWYLGKSYTKLQDKKNANKYLKVEKPLYIYKENGEYTDEILEIYNMRKEEQ